MTRTNPNTMFLDVSFEQDTSLRVRIMNSSPNYCLMSKGSFIHCTSLRVLSLGDCHNHLDLVPLLRSCGSVLRELHMTGPPAMAASFLMTQLPLLLTAQR